MQEESDPEYDDDGRPLTIAAAQKLFHKDNKYLHVDKLKYQSKQEAEQLLMQGQTRIQEVIQKARFKQVNQIGTILENTLKTENGMANMPQIRMMSKNRDKRPQQFADLHKFGAMTSKNAGAHMVSFNLSQSGRNQQNLNQYNQFPPQSTAVSTTPKKPRIDYNKMIEKIQKTINGDVKPQSSPIYKAARPQHKYKPDQIATRVMYSEVCRKQRHSLAYDNFDGQTGNAHFQVYNNFLGQQKSQMDHKANDSVMTMNDHNQFNNGQITGRSNYSTAGGRSKTSGWVKPGIQTNSHSVQKGSLYLPVKMIDNPGLHRSLYGGSQISGQNTARSTVSRNKKIGGNFSKSIGLQPFKLNISSNETEMEKTLKYAVANITARQLGRKRIRPVVRVMTPPSDNDDDKPELFAARPSEEIPRNKLTENLARGLQAFVQRMQKKQSFYVEMQHMDHHNWMPAPREYSTLTYCNKRCYLIGGLNFETNNEIAQMKITRNDTIWKNIEYTSDEKLMIKGRCRHQASAYNDKIYIFGGCFMFNRKRQIRECTSQVLIYDTIEQKYNVLRTKGISIQPRKDHCAAIFGHSMIVYGGMFENGAISNEIINLDLQYNDWSKLTFKQQNFDPFYQAACCSVTTNKKNNPFEQVTRISDSILDGIYFFGGKVQNGEISDKLRFLKPTIADNKVISVEWQKIKQMGVGPCARVGHTLQFLPVNNCLIVAGGRNDKECKNINIPFLEDMYLFLLDQKSWIEVRYIPKSQQLCKIGNHSMAVMSDGETYEKIIIFGGITNFKDENSSTLGNSVFQLEIKQIM